MISPVGKFSYCGRWEFLNDHTNRSETSFEQTHYLVREMVLGI